MTDTNYRLLPVALHPAIEEALKRYTWMPESAWQDVIAAADRVKPAVPAQSYDLTKLRKLAEAATPGPWMHLFGDRTVYDRMEDGCRGNPIVSVDYPTNNAGERNLAFVAAANPAVILRLLDALAAPERSGKTADEVLIGAGDPMAFFADFCERNGYASDSDMDAVLQSAFYEGIRYCSVHTPAASSSAAPSDAEEYLRGKYGAYRGHHAWRELEEAFNAGRATPSVQAVAAGQQAGGGESRADEDWFFNPNDD